MGRADGAGTSGLGGAAPPSGLTVSGLWYPIVVALMTFVIGLLFVPETKDRDIYSFDGPPPRR